MLKTKLVLPNGMELSSGAEAFNAIRSVTLTQCVNSHTELMLGSVCSSMLEAELIAPEGTLSLAAGTEVMLYRNDTPMGIFILERPTRASANCLKLTAYDRISLLDQDLTDWLAGLVGWPYSLYKFAWMVCAQCGLELANEEIPNGEYPVQQFSGQGITGRQLLQWVGEAAGRFCRATVDGKVEFDWYRPLEGLTVGVDIPYFQNSLRFEDYSITPIAKLQLRQNEEDVGTVYPDAQGQANTYRITGNYLLTGEDGREAVAQTLYEQLKEVSYTPCKVTVPANLQLEAGQILNITDKNGKTVTAYVMKRVQAGQRDTLECTGSRSLDSTAVVNQQSYKALSGRVLELQTQVQGLKAENRDAQDNAASLALEVEGIRTQVQQQAQESQTQQQQLTNLEQTARQVQLSVQTIQTQGTHRVTTSTGFTFDETGLTVEKDGSDLTNRIDEQGMHVIRGGDQVMLRANVNGVLAADVSVRNYLMVGDHARFEDYADGNRTACFFIGG